MPTRGAFIAALLAVAILGEPLHPDLPEEATEEDLEAYQHHI